MEKKFLKVQIDRLLNSTYPLTEEEVRYSINSKRWTKEEIDNLLLKLEDDYKTFKHNDTKWVIDALKSIQL